MVKQHSKNDIRNDEVKSTLGSHLKESKRHTKFEINIKLRYIFLTLGDSWLNSIQKMTIEMMK